MFPKIFLNISLENLTNACFFSLNFIDVLKNIYFLKICKGRVTEKEVRMGVRERQRETEKEISMFQFIPQIAAITPGSRNQT